MAGNGQRELAEVIYGLRRPTRGRVRIFGRDVTGRPVGEIASMGVSLVPEERVRVGIIPDFSVADNLVLERVDEPPFSSDLAGPLRKLNGDEVERYARELIERFSIVTPSPHTRAGNLSGGNIQRLILARELSRGSSLIVAEEPTAGLDVGATEFIRRLLLRAREEMNAVLLISGDLSEVLSLSDRVAVMYEGEIVGVFRPGEVSIDDVGLMMTGVKRMPREEVLRAWSA